MDSKNVSSKSAKFKKFFGHGINAVGNGLLYNGERFKIKFSAKGALNILDKTVKTGKGKVDWAFRLDTPHKGVPTHHININPKISGVPDPHIPISSAQFSAGKKAFQVLDNVNKVAVPVAIAIDTVRIVYAVYKDIGNGTSRNIVETGAGIAGGWSGGYGGAMGGAAIGTAIMPGIGTLVGAGVGGIVGGIGVGIGAEKLAEFVSDKFDYNVKKQICPGCQKIFKAKLYKGEKDRILCENCLELLQF
uniref:Uncharacterized protein n=1 Tax=Panagrolaimus superbus TaxID=310955 RepID=A0A914XYZ1_9BILA